MKNMHKKTLLIFIIILFSACTSQKTLTLFTDQNKIQVVVELAETPIEHAQGLMHRISLPNNHGMLFLFEDEQPHTFWMKNTIIPLDIIFFNNQNKVVDIKQNFQPCKKDPCEQFNSKPSKYALEVNAGFVEKYNIKIGDEFLF